MKQIQKKHQARPVRQYDQDGPPAVKRNRVSRNADVILKRIKDAI